jgi:hypothetical protein
VLPRLAAFSGDASPAAAAPSPSAKYLRLLQFVEEHSTVAAAAGRRPAAAAACGESASASGRPAASAWGAPAAHASADASSSHHFSYDEEAEEGGELSEPEMLAGTSFAAAARAQPAAAPAADAASSTSVYSTPYWHARLAGAAPSSQEAAGPASSRRRRSLGERPGVRPALGDLESMSAWIEPTLLAAAAQAQREAAHGTAGAQERYASIMSFIERSAVGPLNQTVLALARFKEADDQHGEPRSTQSWVLTFDEDVHGECSSVLGSC